ncbi:DUF4136 domain-containing protein [Terriglobus roseus]|uniref:DUF4136 domain-containing protein n=1 Tax=Terriglobus roseus TaxID=392734 RepID=A0A1G7L334_9BACT|nr:DUF4136 domain-containing protein [Terriglobus roseus]SDF43962.1 protein of unknown function [Terriglobus roseus]
MKTMLARTLLLFALSSTVAASAQKTSVDYDHSTNFSSYHTYSWGQVKTVDSIWADRIKNSVDQQLQAKGWTKVADGGDVAVAALGQARNQQEEQTFYSGGGWGWGPGVATTSTYNTRQGTLVIAMFDTKTKKLIWRGVSDGDLSGKPEKNIDKLNKSIAKFFKVFPPSK